MAFISSSNISSGKSEVPTVQGVSTANTDVIAASLSHDTDYIKWNLALLSMRADRFWKKIGKKITIQGSDSTKSQDRGRKESYKKDPKVEEPAYKAMMAIDGVGWDWSYMTDEEEDHALVADEDEVKARLGNQRLDKDKKGVGFNEYSAIPPPPAQIYSPPKKDLSWKGLPEFVDDTATDNSRPIPSVDVVFRDYNIENTRKPTVKYAELYRNILQSSNVRSNNFGPPIIEDWDSEDKSDTESTPIETIRPNINQNKEQPRGNQRNWNNLKSQQLGKDFVMQNKACYKCGSFEHLKVNCNQNKWVNKGKNWSRVNYNQGNMTPKAILLKSGTKPIAPNRSFSTARSSLNVAQPKLKSFVKTTHSNVKRPFERKAVAKNKIRVPTVRTKNPTVGSKVPTAKPIVIVAKGNKGKAVKVSAR
ncbi:hypothetical protein Tco_0941842 [Tanacetum coccineum]|uniref:CCHC-type domain-containing protein n=1 Tax=Tanacetum coccineum TaxID=301880 RepID=A0ABQ5DST8_9ASTR